MNKKQTILFILAVEAAIHWPIYAIPLILWLLIANLTIEFIEDNDEAMCDFPSKFAFFVIWPLVWMVELKDGNLAKFLKKKFNLPSIEFHKPVTFIAPKESTQENK